MDEQAHILRKRKGSWILDKSMVREEIPKAIEDIIWRRLIGLSRKHQDMIGILSVLGSSFEMDVARKLLEKEERWDSAVMTELHSDNGLINYDDNRGEFNHNTILSGILAFQGEVAKVRICRPLMSSPSIRKPPPTMTNFRTISYQAVNGPRHWTIHSRLPDPPMRSKRIERL